MPRAFLSWQPLSALDSWPSRQFVIFKASLLESAWLLPCHWLRTFSDSPLHGQTSKQEINRSDSVSNYYAKSALPARLGTRGKKCFGWVEGAEGPPCHPWSPPDAHPGLGEGLGNGIRHWEGFKTGLQRREGCSKELSTLFYGTDSSFPARAPNQKPLPWAKV